EHEYQAHSRELRMRQQWDSLKHNGSLAAAARILPASAPGEPAAPPISFVLPAALEASGPPEQRGLRRDHVRLLVLNRRSGAVEHTRFDRIGDYLNSGALLVLNDSRTIPALLPALLPSGESIEVRLAHQVDQCTWDALLLPHGGEHEGKRLRFRAGLSGA